MKRKPEDKKALLSHEPTLKAIAQAAEKNPECLRNTISTLAKDLNITFRRTRHPKKKNDGPKFIECESCKKPFWSATAKKCPSCRNADAYAKRLRIT